MNSVTKNDVSSCLLSKCILHEGSQNICKQYDMDRKDQKGEEETKGEEFREEERIMMIGRG